MKILLVLMFALVSLAGRTAELLDRISDDTAQVPDQSQESKANQPKIIYRVICTPEGEKSPECGQLPVEDFIEPVQNSSLEQIKAEPPAVIIAGKPEQPTESGNASSLPKKHLRQAKHKKHQKTHKKSME